MWVESSVFTEMSVDTKRDNTQLRSTSLSLSLAHSIFTDIIRNHSRNSSKCENFKSLYKVTITIIFGSYKYMRINFYFPTSTLILLNILLSLDTPMCCLEEIMFLLKLLILCSYSQESLLQNINNYVITYHYIYIM